MDKARVVQVQALDILGDANAVRENIGLENGTRQLINQCPVVPANEFNHLLQVPCDVERLNELLDSHYMSDKKKRNHPSTAERKANKRANLGNYPPTEKKSKKKGNK